MLARHVPVNGSSIWVAEHIPTHPSPLPAVVLVAGLGATSQHWRAVQRLLPPDLRSFTYDRLGLGRSDRTPLPRDAAALTSELKAALVACHVPAPYLLVLHSYAGIIGREFLARWEGEVAAVVMVDANQEHTLAYRAELEGATGRMHNPDMSVYAVAGLAEAHRCTPDEWAALEAEEAAERAERTTGSDPAANEARHCEASLAALASHNQLANQALGTRPLSVIVGNLQRDLQRIFGAARDAGRGSAEDHATVDAWLAGLPKVEMRLAREMLTLSSVNSLVVTEVSGHAVGLWEPELVVGEVGWCLERLAGAT